MRERVWAAAHVELSAITLDTDTTVHTLFGQQIGARKGYNPRHRDKPSYQPILTFLAETREYAGGELRKGDRPVFGTPKPLFRISTTARAALHAIPVSTYRRMGSRS